MKVRAHDKKKNFSINKKNDDTDQKHIANRMRNLELVEQIMSVHRVPTDTVGDLNMIDTLVSK